ncbi:hypothetical protein J4Q44_G00036710, partial [Coregonus suidteri]
ISPPAEHSVRLVNGTTSCSGTVEVFYEGEWLGLCPRWWWSMRETKVVCRELGCGNAVAASRGPLVEDGRRGVTLYWVAVEMSLLLESVTSVEQDLLSVMVDIIIM